MANQAGALMEVGLRLPAIPAPPPSQPAVLPPIPPPAPLPRVEAVEPRAPETTRPKKSNPVPPPGRIQADFNTATGTATVTLTSANGAFVDPTHNLAFYQAICNAVNASNLTYSTVTASTMTTINDVVWNVWNTAYATGSAATTTWTLNDRVWTAWNDRHVELCDLRTGYGQHLVQRYGRNANVSEEELKRRLEEEKRYREAAEKRALEERLAKQRAERLLLACLSPEQREDLEKKGCFYVEIPVGEGKKERYRIDRGSHGNVFQLDEKGSILRSFCIQPPGVPAADAMLAQKLFVESDEETRAKFWEIANITDRVADPKKRIPFDIPRRERYQYAKQHGLLH